MPALRRLGGARLVNGVWMCRNGVARIERSEMCGAMCDKDFGISLPLNAGHAYRTQRAG